MQERRETNFQVDSSYWLKTTEEKKRLIAQFMEVYADDLAGRVDPRLYPDKESRIAEKHTALSIMRVVGDQDDLWIMPIGRNFPAPDRLPPEASQPIKNSENSISRFQAVIVYDKNSGGMTVFDFGNAGCELQHSGQDCMKRYRSPLKYGNEPSYNLTMALLAKATKDLSDPIHKDLYEGNFGDIAAKAEEATATTILNMGELGKLGLGKDTTCIQSGFPGKGCELISLAPKANFYDAMNKDEAYIRQRNTLRYFNKATDDNILIPADERMLAVFDKEMTSVQPINKTTNRILSENELKRITAITSHQRSPYKAKLAIGVLPLLAEENDLTLVFGPHGSKCSLSVSSRALQPFANVAPAIQAPDYLCDPCDPSSKKLLVDPVTTPSGKTYERENIERYIKQHHKDPDGKPLRIDQLIPNLNLREALEKYNSGQSATTTSSSKWPSFFDPSKSMIKRGETDPEYLCDPISSEIMKDPVMTPNGKTYERESIEDWIKRKGTDPATRGALTIQDLRPNDALKALIQAREESQAQQRPGSLGH